MGRSLGVIPRKRAVKEVNENVGKGFQIMSTLRSPTPSHGLHEHSMAVFPTVYMESMGTP